MRIGRLPPARAGTPHRAEGSDRSKTDDVDRSPRRRGPMDSKTTTTTFSRETASRCFGNRHSPFRTFRRFSAIAATYLSTSPLNSALPPDGMVRSTSASSTSFSPLHRTMRIEPG